MEGGLLHWRVQHHDLTLYPTVNDYLKSLPSPPSGFYWLRNDDHTWMLAHESANNLRNDTNILPTEPVIINHLVMNNDTIQGICLKYRISVADLRRVNMFSGNHIKSFKILKIPIEPGVPFTTQIETQEYILQKFKNETNENTTEAKIYLEDNSWDYDKALLSWKDDDKYLKQHSQEMNRFSSSTSIEIDLNTDDNSATAEELTQNFQLETESSPLLG